jgi:hypothetical protein
MPRNRISLRLARLRSSRYVGLGAWRSLPGGLVLAAGWLLTWRPGYVAEARAGTPACHFGRYLHPGRWQDASDGADGQNWDMTQLDWHGVGQVQLGEPGCGRHGLVLLGGLGSLLPAPSDGYTDGMTVEPIAYVYFDYGVKRPVYEDARGQFVFDDDGNRVDGIWYIPLEECPRWPDDAPLIVRHKE